MDCDCKREIIISCTDLMLISSAVSYYVHTTHKDYKTSLEYDALERVKQAFRDGKEIEEKEDLNENSN